jgi:molecular chaperone DnaK
MTKLIERNTTIPTRKSEIFTTAEDSQTSVEIHVLQGERDIATHNKTLGKFTLANIPPAPRGLPQVEVTFDIDANGIVNVTAQDKGTGQEQKITISGSTALSDDEIDRMVTDAESHADEDQKKKEAAEARNNLDNIVYATEKAMSEMGDKVGDDVKSEVEEALESAKKALEGDDAELMREETTKLQEASYKVAQVAYQDAEAAAESADEATAEASDAEEAEEEEVADFEVVEEDD